MTQIFDEQTSNAEETLAAQTIHALRAASALVERAIGRALEPHGLTASQFSVLQIMGDAKKEALGCSELGKRLAGPSSDVTRLLDRLETGGLVSRERDREDRRVVHTRISEKGLEVLERASPSVREAEQQALSTLTLEDRRALAQILTSVQRNLPNT